MSCEHMSCEHIMRKCKKCGSNRISGPSYDRNGDRLNYRCLRCGYSWDGPCNDAEKDGGDDLHDMLRRLSPPRWPKPRSHWKPS